MVEKEVSDYFFHFLNVKKVGGGASPLRESGWVVRSWFYFLKKFI